VDLKRALGLALCAVTLALVVWGLLFARMGGVSIKIDLPPAATPKPPAPPKTVEVFIDQNGAIRVNNRPSSLDALPRDVAAASVTPDKSQQPVRIRAMGEVKYETLVAVTQRLQGVGWSKVGLIGDVEQPR
jgi:biopolymer transport protein ExbD